MAIQFVQDERSAAQQFMEEHDALRAELLAVKEHNTTLRLDLDRSEAIHGVMASEIDSLRAANVEERARTRAWMAHTLKLIGQFDAINAVMSGAQIEARQAAQNEQALALDAQMTDEDREKLTSLFERLGAANDRQSD